MSKRLSFSIAINLLTENFKKGTNQVKQSLRSMQMQVLTFAAALGAGGLGLSGMISRFRDVSRETSRVITALKNVSGGTREFADNMRFLNDMAAKYGLEINSLTGNYAGFTASATQANMPIKEQQKIFESLSRATVAFGLSAENTNSVFIALQQMMSKGKISMEELRKQMGEKLPIAIQAMANALGVPISEMEKLISKGVESSKILPKFADALNQMIPSVDTDNLEASLNKLSNAFGEIVNASGFQDKYKALIDWLTSAVKSAGNNIQNIVVGIVAAIAFAISSSLTKVYKSYADNGKKILANEEITSRKMRNLAASHVEAKNRLKNLELQHAQATGAKQVTLAARVEEAKIQVQRRSTAAREAIADRYAAAEKANAIKSAGVFGNIGAMFVGTAKKIGTAIKSLWASFAPAIIISAIVAVVGHFKNLREESKRIKNIFSDYKKDAESISNTQEVKMLEAQLKIMNDKTRSQKEINAAQSTLQKMLGNEKLSQEEINKKVVKRIELLKEAARADFYAQKAVEVEHKIKTSASSVGLSEDQVRTLAEKRNKEGDSSDYFLEMGRTYASNGVKGAYDASGADKIIKETIEDLKVLADANKELENSVNFANNQTTKTSSTDPDKEAVSASEKRLQALRQLDEEDRKRQIDKQKFDLDQEQKSIDLMNDSFEKRTKQTLLNLRKEELEIAEFEDNLRKQGQEHLKTKYESEHGTNKGFESYYSKLGTGDLQNMLPEGLRPSDIAKQVEQLTDSARKSQQKGLSDINSDLSNMLREQEVMFASDLERKLTELDNYYNEQRIKAGNNAELIAQIEANRNRETIQAKTTDRLQNIDFNEQLESERVAGMESIGMTELVEVKKLELTKRYIQQRIEALQVLADAGDEDAEKQVAIYEQQIKSIDATKPATSLKALADKAIFETIKNGFIKIGDSTKDAGELAKEADEKTISLLGSIAKKASMVATITSGLQSMFGGLNEGLDEALSAVGNISQGFAQGGLVGGAMAVIGEGMKLFSKASEAAERHQKALKEIEDARLASQRAYNLALIEQNLLLKEAVTIFGEQQIKRATNSMNVYKDATKEYNKELSQLGGSKIVTGHKKTGMFGWGKGKDVYSSILDEYDDIIDSEGKLNTARIQNIIDTRKMSDETKNYLQNLLNLQDAAIAAQEELRNYLQSTFGSLGDDLMTSLESAIKDKGVNAWEEFGKSGAKVIEQLGKQLAYELFFAEKFKGLQSQLEGVYSSGKSEDAIARDAMDLVGNFYQNIGSQMELAQGFMENWQKEAEKYGLKLWEGDSGSNVTQSTTKGYSVSMDQETGGAILGRITGIHESLLTAVSMIKSINLDSAKALTQNITINDELRKHTDIFNEMQQMQVKSYRKIENIESGMSVFTNIKSSLESINKNTKKL